MNQKEIEEGLIKRILGLAKPPTRSTRDIAEIPPTEKIKSFLSKREVDDIQPTTGELKPSGRSWSEIEASPEAQAAAAKRREAQTTAISRIRRDPEAQDLPNLPPISTVSPKPRYVVRPGESVEQAIKRIQAEKKAAENLPDAFTDKPQPVSSIQQGIQSAGKGRQEPELTSIPSASKGRQEPDLPTSASATPSSSKIEPTFDPDTLGSTPPVAATADKPGVLKRVGQALKPDISPLEASLYLHGGLGAGAYYANKLKKDKEDTSVPSDETTTSSIIQPEDDIDVEMNKLRESIRKVIGNV
jgi:hypothetical protein